MKTSSSPKKQSVERISSAEIYSIIR
uniref:Uncharacterized protein n=1 Tax=Rhizophora mucronata TaxID=61149 RepID=A0A2P2JQN6_RHIMU